MANTLFFLLDWLPSAFTDGATVRTRFFLLELYLSIGMADTNRVMIYWVRLDSKSHVRSTVAYARWPVPC